MYQVVNKESGKVVTIENSEFYMNKDKYSTDLKWKKPSKKKKKVAPKKEVQVPTKEE